MLGEFYYNGREVWCHARGVLVQWYVGFYHVRGVFGTMVRRFVPY